MKTNSMYREELLELYSEKPNFGHLKVKTHEKTLNNAGCPDKFTLELNVKNGRIIDAAFHGEGCVISTVSASLLTQKLKGMKLSEAKKLNKSDIDKLLKIEVVPLKVKCELLPLEILKRI